MHTFSKNIAWCCFLCFTLLGPGLFGQPPVIENYPVVPRVTEMREQLLLIAESQLWVRELTGSNDGPQIWEYQKAANIPKNSFWCVAYVVWCHLQISDVFPIPITGWSPALFTKNVVYHKHHKRFTPWVPRGGEVGGVYYDSKGRVAHALIIEKQWGKHFHTYEGNTLLVGAIIANMDLSQKEKDGLERNGIWVAKQIRKPGDIYVASDYIGGNEIRKAMREKNIGKYFNIQSKMTLEK